MSLLVVSVLAYCIGLLAYIVAPVVLAPALSGRLRERLGGWYFGLSSTAFWRSLLVEDGPKYHLVATERDHERRSDRTAVGGSQLDYVDPQGLMGRWSGRPHGVVHIDLNAITNPMLAEICERFTSLRDSCEFVTDEGVRAVVNLESDLRDVSLQHWVRWAEHGCRPSVGETTKRFAYLSQVGFNKSSAARFMLLVFAYLAPILGAAAYQYVVGGNLPSVDVIGIWVSGLGVVG